MELHDSNDILSTLPEIELTSPTSLTSPSSSLTRVGNYFIIKTIGSGQFGKVKLARHIYSGEMVAIKVIKKSKLDPNTLKMVQREVSIMKLLRHPHVIELYEIIHTFNHIFLVMEYASGGEVMDFIIAHGRLEEDIARKFFRQIVSAVDYCHCLHVIHRDLKAENLLLDDKFNIKIIDFGLSNCFVPGKFLETFCGSPTYTAPELIQRISYEGPEIDVWSLGVVLFVLVCGFLPFDGSSFLELFQKIIKCDYTVPHHVSPECRSLLSYMLVVDPNERATIDQVRMHPWILLGGKPVPKAELPPFVGPGSPDDIDDDILSQMVEIGYDREEAIDSILKNAHDDARATYFLLLSRAQSSPPSFKERKNKEIKSAPLTPRSEPKQGRNSLKNSKNGSPAPSDSRKLNGLMAKARRKSRALSRRKRYASHRSHRRSKSYDLNTPGNRNSIKSKSRKKERTRAKHISPPPKLKSNSQGGSTSKLRRRHKTDPSNRKLSSLEKSSKTQKERMLRRRSSGKKSPKVRKVYHRRHHSIDSPKRTIESNGSKEKPTSYTPPVLSKSKKHSSWRKSSKERVKSPPRDRNSTSKNTTPNFERKGRSRRGFSVTSAKPNRKSSPIKQRARAKSKDTPIISPISRRSKGKKKGTIEKIDKRRSGGKRKKFSSTSSHDSSTEVSPRFINNSTQSMDSSVEDDWIIFEEPAEGKKANTTSKTNALTSPKPKSRREKMGAFLGSFRRSLSSSLGFKRKDQPRAVRFPLNDESTTHQDPNVVLSRIKKILEKKGIKFVMSSAYCLNCRAGKSKVAFEVEICRLPMLHLNGVKFGRISGDAWEYTRLCKDLLDELDLKNK